MILTCIGHAKFLLELECGLRIVTDPYDADCGYPITPVAADAVLISHGHHDHAAASTVPGTAHTPQPRIIDQPGEYELGGGVRVLAIEAWHDEVQGAKRGPTLLFSIRAEGLNILHLGDLGHLPTPEQCMRLGDADAVMIPVGGFYTIDAAAAKAAAERLHARIILPMHYRTQANADWPIAPVAHFTALMDEPAEELDLLRIAAGDMMCQPHVAVLRPQSLKR